TPAAATPGGARAPRAWTACLGGLGYTLLSILAFPPVGLWPLAVLAPLPLVLTALAGWRRPGRAAVWAGLGTVPFWAFEQVWLWEVTPAGYPLLCLSLAGFPALFVWLVARASRRTPRVPEWLLVAIAWTGVEVLRGEIVLTGYPWYLAAHPLIAAPGLARPASLLGTYLVSFLAVLPAALAGELVLARRAGRHGALLARRLALPVLLVAAWLGGALLAAPAPTGGSAAIAVIQTNVPQNNKMVWSIERRLRNFARFIELTRQAARASPSPELIIWPETMFPGEMLNPEAVAVLERAGLQWPAPPGPDSRPIAATAFASSLLMEQAELGIPMLVGAVAAEGLEVVRDAEGRFERLRQQRRYNSAFLIIEGQVSEQRYDKEHLTPFGEIIPVLWRWPALQRLALDLGAQGMTFDLAWGTGHRPITVTLPPGPAGPRRPPGASHAEGSDRVLRLAAPICFEATQAGLCRSLTYQGGRPVVDLLANLSNDGWFGGFDGVRRQHMQVAAWRCVELGLPMVRAVNTGHSCWIDQRGRVRDWLPAREDGILRAEIPLGGRGTVFGRVGGVFAWIITAALGAVGVIAVLGRPRQAAAWEEQP
ncbi:MAG TPA: apolipoprotein N-acyltransferase, partial [Phycisphaerales bacterium]|nr:apolipoprotein N-acyltransferase [Phycisphaerales bacterium]